MKYMYVQLYTRANMLCSLPEVIHFWALEKSNHLKNFMSFLVHSHSCCHSASYHVKNQQYYRASHTMKMEKMAKRRKKVHCLIDPPLSLHLPFNHSELWIGITSNIDLLRIITFPNFSANCWKIYYDRCPPS